MKVTNSNLPLLRFFGIAFGGLALYWVGLSVFCSLILPHSELVNAAEEQNWQQVKQLVNQGAHVNGTDERDHTALMYAAMYGRIDIIQLLIAHGADTNATDNIGCSALTFAGMRPRVQAILEKADEKR